MRMVKILPLLVVALLAGSCSAGSGDDGSNRYRWPPARRGHAMVTAADGTLLVFGGQSMASGSRVYLDDTWRFDPVRGTWESLAGPPPGARAQFAMAHDARSDATVVFGGYVGGEFTYSDTRVLAAGEWSRVEGAGPSGRAGAVAAYDAESGVVVVYGGAERPPRAELPLPETWVYDAGTASWNPVMVAESPPLRNEGHPTLFELAMVYDAQSDRIILLIGGEQTWAYDHNTTTWERRADPGLAADFMVAAAYDAGLDRVIAYGGAPTERTQETWAYDYERDTWSRIDTAASPGPLGDHAMAYSSVTGLTYLFGGSADLLVVADELTQRDELWAFDGADWSRVGP
jgi:hypothetical protein